jgi:DNA-binding winged helix-turn-helix (wHTH) protein
MWSFSTDMASAVTNHTAKRIQFGTFEADLRAGELRRSGIRVRLQSQPFKLLAILVEHPGEIVARETLRAELWGADTVVNFDHCLGIAINKLRDALGDSADNPRFVETLAKRGYRFIAPIRHIGVQSVSEAPAIEAPAVSLNPLRTFWPWTTAGLGVICLFFAAVLILRSPDRTPYRIAQVTFSGHVLANDLDVEGFSSSASDGTRVYFSHLENGTPSLAVALAANGEISRFQLPSEIGLPLIGSISPDGSKLVVRSHLQAEPEQHLWIVPTLGGDAWRVPKVQAHDATWMPDGQRLLVASGSDLMIVDADGSDARKLLTTAGLAFWPRWSPDGRRLRFTLRRPKHQTAELWEVNADGSNAHPLFPGWTQPASECCGSWTPDGRDFVFQSNHSGHSEIWVRREQPWYLADRQPHQLTNGPLEYEAPSTAPGGDRVYFVGVSARYELLRAVPRSTTFTALDQNLNIAATDYRLIGLAPGDLPNVTARTPTANLYEIDVNDR